MNTKEEENIAALEIACFRIKYLSYESYLSTAISECDYSEKDFVPHGPKQ